MLRLHRQGFSRSKERLIDMLAPLGERTVAEARAALSREGRITDDTTGQEATTPQEEGASAGK